MKAMLRGVRRVDMTDDSGRSINGFSCFISYPADGVEGEECTKIFISDYIASGCHWSPLPGSMVSIDFTPKGRPNYVSNLDEE